MPKATKKRAAAGYDDLTSTLADSESLRAKEGETTLDADPVFGKTSKLFDENSAAGAYCLRAYCLLHAYCLRAPTLQWHLGFSPNLAPPLVPKLPSRRAPPHALSLSLPILSHLISCPCPPPSLCRPPPAEPERVR